MPAWSINNQVRTPLLLMAGIESLIAYSSVYVGGAVVFGGVQLSEQALGSLAPRAATVAVILLASLVAMGLYQFQQRINFRESAVRLIVGLAAGCVVLAVIFYAFPAVMVDRKLASVAAIYSLILLLLVRFAFVRTVDENVFRHRTLIYGAGKRASTISELRRRADRRGFQVIGRVAAPGDEVMDDTNSLVVADAPIIDVAVRMKADEIVIAMDDRRGNLPVRDLLDAKLRGINVIDMLEFLERETGKIRVDLVNPSWLIFSSGFRGSRFRQFTKRLTDIAVSGVIALFALPLMLLIVLAIKIEDGPRAPVLYRQCRVGQWGKLFSVLKFRSMTVDAEPGGKAVWARENDSRITGVGGILRKFRLDELPQIWNVLLGQMSMVGPRPERPEFVDELQETIPYYYHRHSAKPGVTGWAQLRYTYGASEEDAIEKLQYDLFYVKNQSVMLDIMIILQTVEVVLWSKGAR